MANPVDYDTRDDAPGRVQEWVQCTRFLLQSSGLPVYIILTSSGAAANAMIYSLLETAKDNNLRLEDYVSYLLSKP